MGTSCRFLDGPALLFWLWHRANNQLANAVDMADQIIDGRSLGYIERGNRIAERSILIQDLPWGPLGFDQIRAS